MKILVTGAGGFLGTYLCSLLKQRHDVFGAVHRRPLAVTGCRSIPLDISSPGQVTAAVHQARPDMIVHAAAISSPDTCETDPDAARAVNISGTQHLADTAARLGCRLLYVSSDMVFNGLRGNYTEEDAPAPVNFYGQTKLDGEKICLDSPGWSAVVRITLQYGTGLGGAASFSDWLIGNLRAGKQAPLFADQYRTPTYVEDTARGLELAALYAEDKSLYHLSAAERIDRYAFGLIVSSVFDLPAHLLKRTRIDDAPGAAVRPKDVSLNGSRFTERFKFLPRSVHDGIKAMASFAGPTP